VIFERWSTIKSALHFPQKVETPSSLNQLLGLFAVPAVLVVFLCGAALFLLGSIFRSAAGPSFQATQAVTLGASSLLLSTIYLIAPTQSLSPTTRALERWRLASLFLFPILVWLISAPMLAVVESRLSLFLMHQITSGVFFVFDALGFSLEQRGNVLVLPNGNVGVEEACSGIRSLTGCLFAGSFMAAVYLKHFWGKVALVTASLAFAIGSNLLRSLFLTGWCYRFGAHAIEGTVHDVTGYAVLGVTIIALMCVMPWLTPRPKIQNSAADGSPSNSNLTKEV